MSRSWQHHSMRNKFKSVYYAWCVYKSNKWSKSNTNKRFRRKTKMRLKKYDDETNLPTNLNEISDTWDFPSDGLAVYHNVKNWNKKDLIGLINK